MDKRPRRNPFADIAYLVVFGAFTGLSLYQLIEGTATKFTWFFLFIGGFLFAGTAYRMFRNLTKRDAA